MALFDMLLPEKERKEKILFSFIKEKVEEVRNSPSRTAFEANCMTNIAYLLGIDGVTYNTMLKQFQPINRSSSYIKKNRLHVNKILPAVQNRLARLAKNPPKYDVKPESNDTEDKEAARLSLQILMTMWEKLTLDQKRIVLYMWVQEAGHAYIKVSWDPMLGNIMKDPESGQIVGFEGDVRADITSPLEMFPDRTAKTFDDLGHMTQAKVRKLDYFRDNYDNGDRVKSEGVWLMSAQYEQRINSLNTQGRTGSMVDEEKNSAIELIYYEKRSKKHPMGRMIVGANGVILEDKELPMGEFPFAKFDDTVIGGKYEPEALITHLRPLQDQRNENLRRRADWTNKLLAGKYAVAKGAGLQQESLNDQSGELLQYTPVPNAPDGGRPTAIQIPNMPQWAYTETDKIDEDFNTIIGLGEVSQGNLPSASIPAIGMQLLQEQDQSRIGVVTTGHEYAWARVGMLILKCVQENYILPRKLKIAGKNLQYTVKEITGDQIRGNTDVFVVPGSTLPGSKTLKRQEILNAWQQGLLGDPQDPKVREKVLGMLEYGDVAEVWQDFALDMAQITKGIKLLESGQAPPIHKLDNHELWIQELNRYRKGDKFETLDFEKQELLEFTMDEHMNELLKLSGAIPPDMPEDMQGDPEAMMAEANTMAPPGQNAAPPPQGAGP
jgi:hypothetical protein